MALLLAAACLSPTAVRADAEPTPTPRPPLIEQRGLVAPSIADALAHVTFRPFFPVPAPSRAALIAPFHGGDDPKYYGIAFEYTQKGKVYVLRQWPRAGGSLNGYAPMPGEAGCTEAYLTSGTLKDVRGIAWLTNKFAFALSPDEDVPADKGRGLRAEWSRLVHRGACR